jgi:hypothetical protein
MAGSKYVKNDFQKTNDQEKSFKIEEKSEKITNVLFGAMIILTISGTGFMIQKLNAHTKELTEIDPSYNFPKIQDLSVVIIIVGLLIV